VVTFKNSHLKDILKDIINNIVLETDSPYLTPHPYRGTQNNPSYIKLIANFICDYLNLDLSQLSIITNNNIKEIFDI
jgi:TatD DNase family protein